MPGSAEMKRVEVSPYLEVPWGRPGGLRERTIRGYRAGSSAVLLLVAFGEEPVHGGSADS